MKKRGILSEYMLWFILFVVVVFIILVATGVLKINGQELISKLKSILRI